MIKFDDLEIESDPVPQDDATSLATIELSGATYGFHKALLLAYHCGRLRGRFECAEELRSHPAFVGSKEGT